MKIIVCLDDGNGMLFNKRRQSSDAELCKRIIEKAENRPVFMNNYSSKLFDGGNIIVDDNFLNVAQKGDYCFVENTDIMPNFEKTEQIIIYRWNRKYPSDVKFSINLLEKFKLISSENFKGNSHPEITEEIYGL